MGLSFCVVLLIFGLIKFDIIGQSSPGDFTAAKIESEKPKFFDDKPAEIHSVKFPAAETENAKLKNTLAWTFSAKRQSGWNIYIPLIKHTIETEDEAETPEFARAVAGWQRKHGIAPSGNIDDKTLMKMVALWQSRRVKSSKYPSAEELLTAPAEDFYDRSRDAALRQVERETYNAYKKMVAAAAQDLKLKPNENFLRIISAFRSREYQDKLRRESPGAGRAALAVNSPHFTGRALDIYVGGEPTITKDANRALQVQTPAYKWLVKNAERFGFYPYYYEPWHWEYTR